MIVLTSSACSGLSCRLRYRRRPEAQTFHRVGKDSAAAAAAGPAALPGVLMGLRCSSA